MFLKTGMKSMEMDVLVLPTPVIIIARTSQHTCTVKTMLASFNAVSLEFIL
jgi:hypothetical protein